LKGLGFFLGGGLMATVGFRGGLIAMIVLLSITLIASWGRLESGTTSYKPKFTQLLSKSRPINLLSAARFFLFGSRDIWFVVALPVFLHSQLQWTHLGVGTFMASWIIGYGVVQALAPRITEGSRGQAPRGFNLLWWGVWLSVIPIAIALCLWLYLDPAHSLIIGLIIYAAVFAINASIHSFLIVAYAERDSVATDVGFYYMANAAGRLAGTLLSGMIFQQYGLIHCLLGSAIMVAFSALIAAKLPD
jgi:hypothetical protein